MDKHYTEVLIDGTIYTLGGTEEETYLQKVALYLNEKIGQIRKQNGFSKQSAEYQALMIELNVADDYFKEQERADLLAEQKAALEKDAYSLKHELITTQMKYDSDRMELESLRIEKKAAGTGLNEAAKREIAAARAEADETKQQLETAKAEASEAKGQLETAKAEAAEIKQQLETAKAEAAEANGQLETAKAEAAEAQGQLEAEKAKAGEAQGMQALAEEEAGELRAALEDERTRAQQLKREYDALKQQLEQLKAIQAAAAAGNQYGTHR